MTLRSVPRARVQLSWNEIRSRALSFSKEFAEASYEKGEAADFLTEFFAVFGITRRRVSTFEHAVKKHGGGQGFVDLFWPGVMLVEMKSRGRPLEPAFEQALDYFPGIAERDLPRYVLVSDFARFELHDLETKSRRHFLLKDLHKNVRLFGFMAGYTTQEIVPQDPINVKAAEKMGELHDHFESSGYTGHPLQVYLVRLLFGLFADDTGIFQKGQLQEYIELRTREDGSDLGLHLDHLFHVLNTPLDQRLKNLDESLNDFPYVNGKLFEERLPPAAFSGQMRDLLLDLCALDWSLISPAIFGSLFQSIANKEARRNLGAHYTSEENILKVIKPLFLDALWEEFEKVRRSSKRLLNFQKKLSTLNFLDPACGCGNFLVITYRELRLLELEILRALYTTGQDVLNVGDLLRVDVGQFYGIEIDEFPAHIAQVALWLTDHQMNLKVSEEFGLYYARIPLVSTPNILHANALRSDWEDLLDPQECSYVLGNPPFVGAKYLDAAQKRDCELVFDGIPRGGQLDLVVAWYVKSVRFMKKNRSIETALVSTNSICQGEQVGVLWSWMLAHGVKINFAHRTFAWTNEAPGKAAVHCIIVGFGLEGRVRKVLYEYEHVKGEPLAVLAKNINPYLVDGADLVVTSQRTPICAVPAIGIGNKPIDGGHYLFTDEEKAAFLEIEPKAAPFFRRWIGADEFINGYQRWCLWLGDAAPHEIQSLAHARARVDAVRRYRQASKSEPTRKLAATPTRFHVENMPSTNYLVIPQVSSENRQFIPIGYESPETLASNLVCIMPNAGLYEFGMLSSTMHNAWMRAVGGRLESRYRYSIRIVYNNFPWPTPSDKQRVAIEKAAQAVLDARAAHPKSNLAALYDPVTMPPNLVAAHRQLDRAVDSAYGFRGELESARVALLFALYEQLTSLLPPSQKQKRRKRAAGA